eukprot:3092938-Amphidinium_carterae.1
MKHGVANSVKLRLSTMSCLKLPSAWNHSGLCAASHLTSLPSEGQPEIAAVSLSIEQVVPSQ